MFLKKNYVSGDVEGKKRRHSTLGTVCGPGRVSKQASGKYSPDLLYTCSSFKHIITQAECCTKPPTDQTHQTHEPLPCQCIHYAGGPEQRTPPHARQ